MTETPVNNIWEGMVPCPDHDGSDPECATCEVERKEIRNRLDGLGQSLGARLQALASQGVQMPDVVRIECQVQVLAEMILGGNVRMSASYEAEVLNRLLNTTKQMQAQVKNAAIQTPPSGLIIPKR